MVNRFVLSLIVGGMCLLQAADIEGSFFYDEVKRDYLLHIPPSYSDTDSIPLVINLHWGDGTPQGLVSFCGMNSKADEEGFFVVYPAGKMIPAGFTCWNGILPACWVSRPASGAFPLARTDLPTKKFCSKAASDNSTILKA